MTDPEKTVPRQHFLAQIENACTKLGAGLTWHSDEWIAEIECDWRRFFLIGQTFPLNDAAAANVANDKVGTCTVLGARDVPAVPHHLMRFGQLDGGLAQAVEDVCSLVGLPVVLKPHKDSGGFDVVRARDDAELLAALHMMSAKYRAITVSPFVRIEHEIRVVMLDDEVLLTYRKLVPEGAEWRHNLCHGALPEVIPAHDRDQRLVALARSAMDALALRFATVDVVEVDGALSVLEVNSGVTLEHFSRAHPDNASIAEEVYWKALQACVRA